MDTVLCSGDHAIMEWSIAFLTEFQSTSLYGGQLRNTPDPVMLAWKPPPHGTYKINTDAAFDGVGQVIGIGIVIQDESGNVIMASSSQRIIATYSPQVAEAVAVLRGLQLACDTGLAPVVAETDAAVVAKWISEKTQLYSEVGLVIADILTLVHSMRCCSVDYVPRKANQVAHLLAKMALSNLEDLYWMEDSPPCNHV
ncbi:hypothetical protein Dsin_020578 [Dipteronia sinensis]|uniref:RNase H type-1 domain-containing protein n=1 Tax=Dipteronia sinensis TaxID=43782 RepID=A0AAE0E3M4_9ROSI|nr:hypothetical protein Dsin_020578 [Dipteronia sinensis]